MGDRWRHRYVIWGFKDGDIGMSYGDSKMVTLICHMVTQRWRHRYVI